MEASILTEAFKGLVAAGPVATILGIFCYVLWQQNTALMAKLDQQQDKMLRLAVRVQRAVEVLAGLEHDHTEVEEVLEDHHDEQKRLSDRRERP